MPSSATQAGLIFARGPRAGQAERFVIDLGREQNSKGAKIYIRPARNRELAIERWLKTAFVPFHAIILQKGRHSLAVLAWRGDDPDRCACDSHLCDL